MSSTHLCQAPTLYFGSITTLEYFCLTNTHMEKFYEGQEVDLGLPCFHSIATMFLHATVLVIFPLNREIHKNRLSDYM